MRLVASVCLLRYQPNARLEKTNQRKTRPARSLYNVFRFSVFRPKVWNSLLVSIREPQSLPTFRRHLKTFYFQSAYPLLTAHLA